MTENRGQLYYYWIYQGLLFTSLNYTIGRGLYPTIFFLYRFTVQPFYHLSIRYPLHAICYLWAKRAAILNQNLKKIKKFSPFLTLYFAISYDFSSCSS